MMVFISAISMSNYYFPGCNKSFTLNSEQVSSIFQIRAIKLICRLKVQQWCLFYHSTLHIDWNTVFPSIAERKLNPPCPLIAEQKQIKEAAVNSNLFKFKLANNIDFLGFNYSSFFHNHYLV